jgi:hypothetical protein
MGLGSEIRDPRSGIRDPEKTYSGSRIQGSKRHRIPDPGSRIRNTAKCRGSTTLMAQVPESRNRNRNRETEPSLEVEQLLWDSG